MVIKKEVNAEKCVFYRPGREADIQSSNQRAPILAVKDRHHVSATKSRDANFSASFNFNLEAFHTGTCGCTRIAMCFARNHSQDSHF